MLNLIVNYELSKRQKTQKDLATYLNVSEKTLQKWLNNDNAPSYIITKLTVLFSCSSDYLLGITKREKAPKGL